MDAIFIPHLLNKSSRREVIEFEDFLPDLPSLTPVRGTVKVVHQSTFLEVTAQAETIITLTCDRCLNQYNYRLSVDNSELIWLDENAHQTDTGEEVEMAVEDLVECLPPDGYFDYREWLYQQLCLELPVRKLCDRLCPGIPVDSASTSTGDRRWASLEALKNKLIIDK